MSPINVETDEPCSTGGKQEFSPPKNTDGLKVHEPIASRLPPDPGAAYCHFPNRHCVADGNVTGNFRVNSPKPLCVESHHDVVLHLVSGPVR